MSLLYKSLTVCAVFVFGCGFMMARAEAHSIYIFAFPEDSRICTNSYFGGKAKVRGGQVAMTTDSGEVLATAQTDEQGNACFDRPEPIRDLIFTVEASGGHRAEFKLPASELAAEAAADPVFSPEPAADQPTVAATSEATMLCAEVLTERDLQKALSPIMIKLAEMESSQNSRINLKDIIGGLGWLVGLAGAALWASGRKNKTQPKDKS